MERNELADFLRRRRALLQPGDVGVPSGGRRRTPGLRRFEVAQLAGMSPDYYARLEQGRGPRPSAAVLTALTRALRLTVDERDHLFRLAGHQAPPRTGGDEHVSRGLLRLLDGLTGLPALIATDLNVVLAQNAMADALLGELAAINQDSKLVRVGADGSWETLLDAGDGMQGTTAVVVRGSRVYVTNGANLVGDDSNLLVARLRR
ncbi:helix-turn-helix domain-containing protein [Amycolatopsis thermoflava]|uniref:helix-turn-helix domain-containing protein n=1 Tax=Amycolatopsis thermoflava TaxID=84480 RepID=UPI002F930769